MADLAEPTLVPESLIPGSETPDPQQTLDAAVTEAAQETASESPAMSRAEMARALGFDIPEDADDDAVVGALGQWRDHASLGYRFKSNPQEFANYFQPAQQTQQPVQQPAPATSDPWSSLWVQKPDASYFAQVELDETTGTFKPKNSFVPPQVVQAVNDYAREITRREQEFWANPHKTIYEGIKQPLLEEAKALVRAELEQQRIAYEQEQLTSLIQDKGYAKDASGNLLVNPSTGEAALSPWGQAYSQALEVMRQAGATDAMKATRWAMEQADRAAASQPAVPAKQTPAPTPQQVSEQKKEAFLNGTSVNGRPSGFGSSGSAYEPNEMMNADLDNFFVTRARAQGLIADPV